MPYALLYRGQFVNQETDSANANNQQIITIDIEDTESADVVESTIVPLEMAESPLKIEVVDNDEDKFTTIRSKQAIINIHTSDGIGLETFAEGGDNRYKVTIYSPTEMLLVGWLSISDLQEDFLPDPNILTLIATDGLGFLSGEPLTDLNGDNPYKENRIIDYIIWCLAKTGNSLGFVICMNIREENAIVLDSDTEDLSHFFKYIFLDAKTFESEVGESEDCETVLNKIFKRMCFITQKNGLWWIMRVDEMAGASDLYITRWDTDGNFISKSTLSLSKNIGAVSSMQWMNDDAIASTERPSKRVKLTFNYEFSKELICNLELERGEGAEPTGAETETIDYTPECIDFFRNNGLLVDQLPVSGSIGVIRKYYEYGYEKDRYLVSRTAGGFPHYFKLQPLYVNAGDRVRLGISHRFNTDESAVSSQVASVKLYGDDGTVWDWEYSTFTEPDTNQWVLSSASDFTNNWTDDVAGLDNREWKNMAATSNDIPVAGKLVIRLYNQVAPPVEMWFNNIDLEYIPKINGSYQKYTAQVQQMDQSANPEKYKSIIEDQVYISDAPNKNHKGALLKKGISVNIVSANVSFGNLGQFELSGDYLQEITPGMYISVEGGTLNPVVEGRVIAINYSIIGDLTTVYTDQETVTEVGVDVSVFEVPFVLAEGFYDASLHPLGLGSAEVGVPFGELQAYDVWNQVNRVTRKFEGNVDKLLSASEQPDLVHRYNLTDANPNTNNKTFMLLHNSHDEDLCEWEAFFHEIFDSTIEKSYDTHSFKYLTENE